MYIKILSENLRVRCHMGDLSDNIKMNLKYVEYEVMVRI
jgi:hypothetical protein